MSSKYLYNVVAKTGDSVTAGGSLTSFTDTTSINDYGQVAFIGKYGSEQDLLVGDGVAPIQNLSSDFSGRTFASGVEINNNNKVVAIDRGVGFSIIRLWDTGGPGFTLQTIGTGAFEQGPADFENILPFPSLNNSPEGQTAFIATPEGVFPKVALVTLISDLTPGFTEESRRYNQKVLSTGIAKPAISDNGLIVINDPASQIVLQDYQLNITDVIASNFSGFSSVGNASGISSDGNAVVFYGNYTGTGDNPYPGLKPGPGIFLSIKTDTGRIIERIAGIAGNGILDPGEEFADNNNNGEVEPGEDIGLISGFAANERLGVSFNQTTGRESGTVVYLAKDLSGQEALFKSEFNRSSPAIVPTVNTSLVALVGQQANEVASGLTGNIQDINIYDPVNGNGQIAFWLQTTNAEEAVVRVKPIRKPVLLLHGIGGSLPENADFDEWLLNRGVEPNTLRIDPLRRGYDDLIETLKRAGYQEGVDLFIANYDWRLNPGPIETSIDGKIERSAAQLTDDTYEYAVDHLGYWLEEAVKGWKSQFAGLPDSEIPDLDSVDIISHSTGGIVARTYIQSTAYEEPSFKYQDANGNTIEENLPKVDNLIMVGVPNRGSSLAWNPLNNNMSNGIGSFLLGSIVEAAYTKVNLGRETVAFNGNPESDFAIKPLGDGIFNIRYHDPVEFIENYVPTARSLLATYPLIDTLPEDRNYQRVESIDPNQRNTLLLDLNNGFDSEAKGLSPDPNLFAEKIAQATVIYGVNHPTRDVVTERNRPELIRNSLAPQLSDPINGYPGVPLGIWYRNEFGATAPRENPNWQGDGTVPLASAEGQFTGNNQKANIQLRSFIRRDEENPAPDENTDESVEHDPLMFNTDVQKLILNTLNISYDEDWISTGRAGYSAADLEHTFRNISGNIFLDPVEGFLIDRQGRRLGYSQATGPVTEIPNSFWLGETDGIGWIDGLVEGPVKLQLTGIGEEYLVSVAVETTDGPAVIEAQGFLAAGEQQTFNIPVNNAPILDLNTSTEGIDSSMSLTLPQQFVAITDTDLQITDSESTNLQGATVTITNPLDGSLESLNATARGNITVAYDPATSTLTLSGADTIANYQQVLSTVTYTNTAANPNLTSREIAFMINDGASFNNFSPVATTTLTLTTSTSTPTQNLNLTGTSSDDTLVGDSGDDTLSGLEGNDNLDGKAGNDYLDGGVNNDTMIGGAGNDTYIVDSTSDVVTETSAIATEIDTVLAAISYTLGANVENLTLTGTSAINATGNNLNNIITGNSGNNIVDGGAGDDTLIGSAGNDTYVVDSSGDVVTETSDIATQIDTVSAAINYTLGANLENLTLTGTASINGTGNNLNNTLSGNSGSNILDGGAGNDTLNGGTGNDTLIGGAGNDTYVVDTTSDVITESSTLATEIDRVQASVSWALGNNLENLTLTTGANINATGNSLNNTITGNSGSNVLDGGTGNDTLIGGTGNDTYVVDSTSDVISEGSNTATEIDTVQASVSWTLANNLENLTLTGTANINGTGNNLNNTITGNSGNNVLDGSTGNDTLIGGTGNDTYVVDSTSDAIAETSTIATEIDTVQASISWALANNLENLTLTGTANINGTGNSLNNTIAGNSGNNILNGGTGNDTLIGGTGNDTYIVDSTSDAIVEISTIATEIDTVSAATSYTLGANLENLTLTGTSAINGTGNSSSNTLIGNSGNNILDGGAGNDNLIGGAGNDTYIVDSNSDVVTETSAIATEIDTVSATTSYTLGANVENLTLTGTTNINGTGNSLNNTLAGNSGNNVLDGGAGNDTLIGNAGNDTLTGGGGSDRLLYDTNAAFTSSAVGLDLVTDFTIGTDKFVLDKTTFTALTSAAGNGFSISSEFAVVANNAAVGSSGALIVYSSATGNLFYNQDGAVAGLGSGGQFASLSRIPALTASDFIIQA